MIAALSFLYLFLIKIWAPRASWEINEHSYCYWNQHKGILCSACPYLNNNHMLIIHYFISRHNPALSSPSICFLHRRRTPERPLRSHRRGPCDQTRPSRLPSVTLWLPGGCSAPSYLRLCKAGVKHKALVNDQPQAIWLYHTPVSRPEMSRVLLMDFFCATKFLQRLMAAEQWTDWAQLQAFKLKVWLLGVALFF